MKLIKLGVLAFLLILFGACSESVTAAESNDDETEPGINSVYNIADTGQENCYDANGSVISAPAAGEAFYGQDGCAICREPVFI